MLRRPEGHIRAGGVERDVTFAESGDVGRVAIDQAYQAKYASRYARKFIDPMVSPGVAAATLRLIAG